MARLVVLRDPLRGVREWHTLQDGATLADELRRLYPEGFGAAWTVHKAQKIMHAPIDVREHERLKVDDASTYIVTVRPLAGFDIVAFLWTIVASLVAAGITYLLTPKPRTPTETAEEAKESPNNKIAGQSNQLRAGARVPDILGRVRSYPDLLTAAVERWYWPHTQSIVQHFVIGRGAYDMTERRLGETLFTSIDGLSWADFAPGDSVSNVQAIRIAPNVDGISLIAQDSATTATGVTFNAAAKTVTSSVRIGVIVGNPYFVTGTLFNTADFWVTAGPLDSQTVGPYVYTLDGPVVNETSNAIFTQSTFREGLWQFTDFRSRGVPNEFHIPVNPIVVVGDLVSLVETSWGVGAPPGGLIYYGKVTYVEHGGYLGSEVWIRVQNMDGTLPSFVAATRDIFSTFYVPNGAPVRGLPGDPVLLAGTPQYTGWFTAPIEQPDEIWIDIEFPAGLLHYNAGNRYVFTVTINVDFRAVATPGTVVTKTFSYTAASNVTLRKTEIVTLAELAMVGPIEVRMIRTTPIVDDTSTDQYIQDTRWKTFRAVKNMPVQSYPDVTITRLIVFNSQSAASVGESSFNIVATRIVPVLGAGGLGAAAPSERWCDNIIERMKAADGANKTDAQIDLAGIYEIQAALDAQDGGDQGKISMTLDDLQDIDAELQIIASVVRCQVYRIGRKLFVTRDQGGKVPLSLFTARSKSPDGEQVQLAMNNETENDCVIVTWFDRVHGWKQRELQYPPEVLAVNPLRVSPTQSTWAQAWRRAVYEWNRLQYRRDTLSMDATEEARLLHIGDVVNVTDDVANLAQSAGEVYAVAGLTLTLDREVNLAAGGFTILLRALDGRAVETIPVTQGASLRDVVLAHAPGVAVTVKGRDDGLGTMFAIYQTASAVIRPWLVTNLEPGKDYTKLLGVNWRDEVFAGDAATLPSPPPFRSAGEVE